MTALPSIASFTGASITEGDFKTALSNMHLFLSGLLGTTGAASDAQAAIGALLGAGALLKAVSYTVTAADRGKIIACSGTFTVTLPDASTVGSGFAVAVANYDVGTITVDPFSTQTIDGDATKTLIGNSMAVCCAVSGEWLTVGGTPTATTSRAGIVQLVDSVGSTSQTLAPTANACKYAYDTAVSAQTTANAKAGQNSNFDWVEVYNANPGIGAAVNIRDNWGYGIYCVRWTGASSVSTTVSISPNGGTSYAGSGVTAAVIGVQNSTADGTPLNYTISISKLRKLA